MIHINMCTIRIAQQVGVKVKAIFGEGGGHLYFTNIVLGVEYSVTCLNRIPLGPNFSAGLDRDPDYKGRNK